MKIETCMHNLDLGSGQVLQWAQGTNPHLKVEVWDCLDFCETCARKPFLWINDEVLLHATTAEKLWRTLQTLLQGPPL